MQNHTEGSCDIGDELWMMQGPSRSKGLSVPADFIPGIDNSALVHFVVECDA